MTIYLQGDIHGSREAIDNCLNQIKNPTKEDYIIICGDVGLEYGSQIMNQTKKAMKKFPGKWIVMRGNHDNRYWRDHILHHGWSMTKDGQFLFQHKYPNILYVQDEGQIGTINGYKFLFIPGAYSVDKDYRLKYDLPYEYEEQLTETEIKYLKNLAQHNQVDFVISHTYPFSLEEHLKYLFLTDAPQNKIEKYMEQEIDNILQVNKTWKHCFFGHMHDDKKISDKYTLVYRNVICLDDYLGE